MVLEKGEEKTKHWLVLLIFLYGTASPRLLRIRTGIERVNVYLSELVNEGYITREGTGIYSIRGKEDKFINKLLEESGLLLSEKEKELFIDLLIRRPIVKEFIKADLENLNTLRPLLALNPYRFLIVQFYNLFYAYFLTSIESFKDLLKKIEEEKEIKEIKSKLENLPEGIKQILLREVENNLIHYFLDKALSSQIEKHGYLSSLKVVTEHKKEFVELMTQLLAKEENVQILKNIVTKIAVEMSKDPTFSIYISTINGIAFLIRSFLKSFEEALVRHYKDQVIDFYNNLFEGLKRNEQSSQ